MWQFGLVPRPFLFALCSFSGSPVFLLRGSRPPDDVPCDEFVHSLCLHFTHVFRSSGGNRRRPTDVVRGRRHRLRHHLCRPELHPLVGCFCVMTSCFVNRAGSLFCRVLTVWKSQLLISDSWGWRVSPDKTQFNQTSAVLLGDHPLTFLLLGVKHAGLGLELVEWTCFAPTKRAHSHTTSRLSSRSSRGVRLQCKGCCRLHCWLRSRPRTQRMSLT